jgi:hypothetical protein
MNFFSWLELWTKKGIAMALLLLLLLLLLLPPQSRSTAQNNYVYSTRQ